MLSCPHTFPPPSDPRLQLTHITSCTVRRTGITVQACCPEPELTTPIPSVPLVQQKKRKKKKKGLRSIWETTKRKTDSSPLENIIRLPKAVCTQGPPAAKHTNTDEFYCLFGSMWGVSWDHFLLLPCSCSLSVCCTAKSSQLLLISHWVGLSQQSRSNKSEPTWNMFE